MTHREQMLTPSLLSVGILFPLYLELLLEFWRLCFLVQPGLFTITELYPSFPPSPDQPVMSVMPLFHYYFTIMYYVILMIIIIHLIKNKNGQTPKS